MQGASFVQHHDIVPQAYYSEAHLDTLGFCLFLALAIRSSAGDGILVLDDCFTSVDNYHLGKLSELLVECADRNYFAQIIMTTHSADWRDQFGESMSSIVELQPWSLGEGIREI